MRAEALTKLSQSQAGGIYGVADHSRAVRLPAARVWPGGQLRVVEGPRTV